MTHPVAKAAIVTRHGGDRFGALLSIGPDRCFVKVSGRDTGGALSILEWIGRAPGGPPLHLHLDQDETFVVLDGEYRFQCGAERFTLNLGDTIFLPRRIPHTFRQLSPTGRLLFSFNPAGDMEAFFEALAAIDGPPDPGKGASLFAAHGMQVVGAPLEPA